MAVETKRYFRSRRAIGKLAQQRRARRESESEVEPEAPALIFQAMDALPGYTYPSLGAQLQLAGPKFTLSREWHAQVNTAKAIIVKMKKGA